MKKNIVLVMLLVLISAMVMPLSYGETMEASVAAPEINWIEGPGSMNMGELASITIEDPYLFADKEDTVELMEYFGNPSTEVELGSVFPKSEEESWFVIFEYYDTGHVKDDDKDKIDADELLKSMKEGTEAANKERVKLGASPLHTTGWVEAPNYNEDLHSLVWCTRAVSDDGSVLNYEARLLSREGYVSATLVCDEDELAIAKPHMNKIIGDFAFLEGKRYGDYVEGKDKLSEMGLATLVAGGAVVATKKGLIVGLLLLFKKFGIVIFGVLAATVGKFFGKKKKEVVSDQNEYTTENTYSSDDQISESDDDNQL